MATYQYSALKNGAIVSNQININDETPKDEFLGIQKLRTKLHNNGCQFLNIRKLSKNEIEINKKLQALKKLKKGKRK